MELLAPNPITETQAYLDALLRFEEARKVDNPEWDLVTKVFNDVDTLFFHGELKGRVQLEWMDIAGTLGLPHCGLTTTPGVNVHTSPRGVQLRLSTSYDWARAARQAAFAMLIHEMLHAYFGIKCGWRCAEPVWEPGADAFHGLWFMTAAKELERRTEFVVAITEAWQMQCHPLYNTL